MTRHMIRISLLMLLGVVTSVAVGCASSPAKCQCPPPEHIEGLTGIPIVPGSFPVFCPECGKERDWEDPESMQE